MKLNQPVTTAGYYCELGGSQHYLTESCGCITVVAMLRFASKHLAKEKSFVLKNSQRRFQFLNFQNAVSEQIEKCFCQNSKINKFGGEETFLNDN